MIPVTSAARVAVLAILHANFGRGTAEIRAYWSKYKGLKLEDRWYATLPGDAAGMGRWVEAAGNITQPVNVTTYPGMGVTLTAPASTNAPVRMLGESLRARMNPSVTALLARRATEIPPSGPGTYGLSAGCELGLRLAAWDPPAALPVARTLTDRCRTVAEYSNQKNPLLVVARLTLFRMQAGNPQAFDDYAAWLQTTTPEQFDWSLAEALGPLCKYATNAVLRIAADHMFGSTNSPWSQLPWKQTGSYDPVESDLVHVPAFRRLLLRELDKQTPCGTIEWRQGGASYQLTNYWSGRPRVDLARKRPPSRWGKGRAALVRLDRLVTGERKADSALQPVRAAGAARRSHREGKGVTRTALSGGRSLQPQRTIKRRVAHGGVGTSIGPSCVVRTPILPDRSIHVPGS